MAGIWSGWRPRSSGCSISKSDAWWYATDPGWITGHSYIVYGPLLFGATSVIYEGAPNHPFPDRWWDIVERHGVTVLYTAPTAIRRLMRFGDAWRNRHDLSSLRLLGQDEGDLSTLET
jgi:acetyl-CoA synthetase